jgi:hypothetical protein
MTDYNITKFYFSHARTALKFGLQAFNFSDNDVVLFPEYICSVLVEPVVQAGIVIKFYPVNKHLEPLWNVLEDLVGNTQNVRAVLMVHYFGSTQNISKFIQFCSLHNLILIEDNAHGYGNMYNNQLLGTFGDIGICSPRKTLNLSFGGILYLKNKKIENVSFYNTLKFRRFEIRKDLLRRYLFIRFPKLKNCLKKHFLVKPEYDNPFAFQESRIDDYRIDDKYIGIIERFDFKRNFNNRINKYLSWKSLLLRYDYHEIFDYYSNELTPFCFSFYARDKTDALRFFNWGWKNGYYIYSWPSLPVEVINGNSSALKIWEELVCISLDSFAPEDLLNL